MKKIIDIFQDYDKIIRHKGAVVEKNNSRVLLVVKSSSCSPGIFFKLNLNPNKKYKLSIRAKMTQGDKAFVYCETKDGRRLINRSNIINSHVNRHDLSFNGDSENISIGVLCFYKNIIYTIEIYKFTVYEIDYLVNDKYCLNQYVDKVFIINNDDKSIDVLCNKLTKTNTSFEIINKNDINNKLFQDRYSYCNKTDKLTIDNFSRLLTHLNIVTLSKINNYESIMILESNTVFGNLLEQYIDNITEVMNNYWGLLYLFSNNITNNELYSRAINENNSNAYCISHYVYDDIIKLFNRFDDTIDGYLCEIQKKYECYSLNNNLTQTLPDTTKTENITTEIEHPTNKDIIKFQPKIDTQFKPKILISSTQYPYYGGAATNAYLLTKYLREYGFEVSCIFYDTGTNIYDPDNIGGIFNMKPTLMYKNNSKILHNIKRYLNGEPNLIFSFNWYAPIVSKRLYPNKCVLYCITGSTLITKISDENVSFIRFLQENNDKSLTYQHPIEFETMELSDLIVFNSYLTQNNFNHIYFNFNDKFVNIPLELTNVCINKSYEIQNDTPKEYDLIIVNSSYKRKIKNPDFIKELFKLPEIEKLKKVIIGHFSTETFGGLNNTLTLNLIDNKKVYEYLSKSKILLVPSFLESAGIIIEEANYCECSIVTTRNVGLSYRIDDNFLCEDVYDKNEWENKILNILRNYESITKFYDVDYYDNNHIIEFINNILNVKLEPIFDKEITLMIASIDTPYIGGSATNAYRLIKQLRKRGYYVFGLFIDKDRTHDTDPDNIGDIFRVFEYDSTNTKFIRDTINNYIQDIDVIYAKNYITYYILKSIFPEIKIVFSPSGSRAYSFYCGNDKFITFNEFMNVKLDTNNNITNYCYPNSCCSNCNCEKLTVDDCDLIVPNSQITYDLYNKIYKDQQHKIYFPIYLSSIIDESCYEMKIDFNKREIDVICIVYNWNRKVKNRELLIDIIKNDKLQQLKFVIIGYKFNHKFRDRNVDIIDHMDNKDIFRYLGNSKVCILTSYYDSNPNILSEADYMGCNIITTTNTGIGKFINDECLVNNYYDVNEWCMKIKSSIKTKYNNHFPNITEELNKFDHMVKYIVDNPITEQLCDFKVDHNKNIMVVFHSIPSIWSTESYINNVKPKNTLNVSKINESMNDIIDFIESDLYFYIIKNINYIKRFDEIHVVIGNTVGKSGFIQLSEIYPNEYRHIYIWDIPDVESLYVFRNAKIYFMRGKYDLLYDDIIKKSIHKPITIFYPATSLPFNVEHKVCKTKYDIVLYGDPNNYDSSSKIYPYSKMNLLLKVPTPIFYYTNNERIYDACFCATYKQPTKNHSIFVKFINFLEENSLKLNLVFIGGEIIPEMKWLYRKLTRQYKHVNITVFGKISRKKLAKIYNSSNVNLLFSGRDDIPRIITESLFCGCYNITCDTLSDGKFMYQNKIIQMFPQYFDKDIVNSINDKNIYESNYILGEIIKNNGYTTEKHYNISPIIDDSTFRYLYKICKKKYDSRKIYSISKNIFNIYDVVKDLVTLM